MSPEAVSFEKPKTAESEGVTLRIKGTIQEVDRQAVKEIAKKHSLSVTEEKGEVIIKNDYAPSLPRRIENKKGSQ
jgi:stalled ribosome rescue protein Dom34